MLGNPSNRRFGHPLPIDVTIPALKGGVSIASNRDPSEGFGFGLSS